MATTHNSKNRVYLFRLQMLIIDGGLLVLRNILDQKLNVQNISLSACLSQERSTITRLKGQTIITQVQYDQLYPPPGGKPPSTADFDITLIICLLRNLKTCGLNRHFNWNAIPNALDVSVEADIYRLKLYRNEISHISTTTGIQLKDFRFKWTEIEKILLRLNTSVINPVQSLQQTIDDLKTNPLDEEAEERIQKEVDEWRKLEKGVEVVLRRTNLDTQSIKEEMKKQQKGVRQMAEKVNEIQVDLKEIQQQQKGVRQMVEKVDEKQVDLKGEMKQQQKGVRRIAEKVDEIEVDLKDEMKQQQIGVRQVAVKVDVIYKRTSKQTELIKDTQNKVADLEKQMIKNNDTKETQKEQIQLNILEDPDRYEYLKQHLKEDLIVLYRKQYHTLPLSPLIEEHDTPLIKFYVMPDINTVEHKRALGGGSETKSEVESLRDVFYKKGETCCEIYLSADAGFGKTAFSKRLVLTWCQAKMGIESEQKHFKGEDIRAMDEFKFVFFLSLRECSEECDIDEMIMKQIIPQLAHTSVTLSNLETILHKEKCLVILDGLDEWSHPKSACKQGRSDIPHRKARECTILTTTRPWKLSVIGLSSSQIEQKLEIVGLNEESAYKLKKSVISLLCDKPEEHVDLYDFDTAVERKGLSVLETIPLLLMYLLCLWCDGIDLGRSKCELYCQIVELLLKRTFKKYPYMQHADERPQSDIPQYFSEHIHCKNNYSLLKALAQLACERLFNKHKENTLVFDQSVARQYLSQDYLDLCLRSGILTQSKPEQVKLTIKQTSKVSFSHKSVQEYFCALYMSCQNESDVKKIVLQNCSSVQNILDMSTVFVFISGMNAEVMSSISRELMPVISADKITSAYRSTTRYDYEYRGPVKDIQNMYISCCKENPDNNDLKLLCQDISIDWHCLEESYFTNVKQLAIHNKNNMQSIRIVTGVGVYCSLHEVIDSCELADPFNIPKISYWGKCTEEELCRLLNGQAECVSVRSDEVISCSSELCKTLQNNSLLRVIYIVGFKMSHGVMEQFVNCLNRKSMAEIRLVDLSCSTHGSICPGLNLDLTQPSDLRTLGLNDVPVKQLEVNVTQLVDCDVGQLPKPVTSLLRALPAASRLQTFKCRSLESSGEVDMLMEILPKLVTVKHVELGWMNLGERSLSLPPEMINIELVELRRVTMAASTLHGLVKSAETLAHTVRVEVEYCTITPETEFEHVIQYLHTSPNFRITEDFDWGDNWYDLKFETIKC